jgi:hypothetical protein
VNTRVFYQWMEPGAALEYRTGVSLHSHTDHSQESLGFLMKWIERKPFLRQLLQARISRCKQNTGIQVDLAKAYWVPPLTPRMALDLESEQISALGLKPLVSLTDHDNIEAPVLLQTLKPSADEVPISVEWSAPFQDTLLHIGVHNLPVTKAQTIMSELAGYTASPQPNRVSALLEWLSSMREVLLVLNHPLWDLDQIGELKHCGLVSQFLKCNGPFIHALELNGLREWEENRHVRQLAAGWNLPLISGGDRHGCEPNAIVNLTNANTFAEFVEEVRDGYSHLFVLQQYSEPMPLRVFQTVLDAIRLYPDHPRGAQSWDERVFHPLSDGSYAPVASMWVNEQPSFFERIFSLLRLAERGPMRSAIRFALRDDDKLKIVLNPMTE